MDEKVKEVKEVSTKIVNEVAKKCVIFHHTVAYCVKQVNHFAVGLDKDPPAVFQESDIASLDMLLDAFAKLLNYSDDLTAENWQERFLRHCDDVAHYPTLISDVRKEMMDAVSRFSTDDLKTRFRVKYNEEQDDVNQSSDYKHLMKLLSDAKDPFVESEAQEEASKKALDGIMSGTLYMTKKKRSQVDEKMKTLMKINIDMEDVRIDQNGKLGSGGFGTVSKGTLLKTGEIVAVKGVRMDKPSANSLLTFVVEITMLDKMRHPSVLELVGAHVRYPQKIITRYCPGRSLFSRLHQKDKNQEPLNGRTLTKIAYQVARGMRYLHKKQIVHRDLKTLNILLDADNNACVADFGLSGKMKEQGFLIGGAGTPNYTAPEILSRIHYGPKVDVYSYAIVLWEMLLKRVPFNDFQGDQIYDHVVTCNWRLPLPQDSPKALKRLITRCWSKNPDERPTFKEICKMFKNDLIRFPDCEPPIDWKKIQEEKHCPPVDEDYVLEVLKDMNNKYFDSVSEFICKHVDDRLRGLLREKGILDCLMQQAHEDIALGRKHKGSILSLANCLLEDNVEHFRKFMDLCGMDMFEDALATKDPTAIAPALLWAARLPGNLIDSVSKSLPTIVKLLGDRDETPNNIVLEFLMKLDDSKLKAYRKDIADVLPTITAGDITEEKVLKSFSRLSKMCKEELKQFPIDELRPFKDILKNVKFRVDPEFVQCLIELLGDDTESIPDLILGILISFARSNLSEVLKTYVLRLDQEKKEIFDQLIKTPKLLERLGDRLGECGHSDNVTAALFLLFCIARREQAPTILAHHEILATLLDMKRCSGQRLHIFAALCFNETFCTMTSQTAASQQQQSGQQSSKIMDGIIHLLASSLTTQDQKLVNAALRLLLAMSMHAAGCKILQDNDVFELFVQHFLSSSFADVSLSYIILRNAMKYRVWVPQMPLIASCLLQSLLYDMGLTDTIMDTLVALVKTQPGCVQAHDIQVYVLRLTKEAPLMSLQALRLLAAAGPEKLKNIVLDVLTSVTQVLNLPKYHHPKIIKAALMVIKIVGQTGTNIDKFIEDSHLIDFVKRVISLLPKDDKRAKYMEDFVAQWEQNRATSSLA